MKKVFTSAEIFQAAKEARDRLKCYVSVDICFYAHSNCNDEFAVNVYNEKLARSIKVKGVSAAIECLNDMGKNSEPENEGIEFEEEVA